MFKLTATVFSVICFIALCRFSVSQDFNETFIICNIIHFFNDTRFIDITCPSNSKILLEEAQHGVPNINNSLSDNPCHISSSDDECLLEFTQELNRWCSGRQNCKIQLHNFPNWWANKSCIYDAWWKNKPKLVYIRYACIQDNDISRCSADGGVENHHMNLSHTSGYLQSPNYPDSYPDGEYNCLWWLTMTASEVTTGIFTVYHFELENNDNSKCDNSYLQINNNNEKYCDNKTLDGLSFHGSDTFSVEFIVTGSSDTFSTENEGRGFFIHYQVTPAIETTETASAETTINTPSTAETQESSTETEQTFSTTEPARTTEQKTNATAPVTETTVLVTDTTESPGINKAMLIIIFVLTAVILIACIVVVVCYLWKVKRTQVQKERDDQNTYDAVVEDPLGASVAWREHTRF